MYRPIVLYISLRYMRGRSVGRFGRFVSWLSTIGIIFSIIALVIILSVMNGLERKLENNILDLMPQVLLTGPKRLLDPKQIPASVLNSLTGVTRITSLTTSDVVLQSKHSLAVGVMIGINPTDTEPLSNYFSKVRQDYLISGKYRIILGSTLAKNLGVDRFDVVRLIVPSVSYFTPLGRFPTQRLFTIVDTFSTNSEVDSYQFLVNQQDASFLMRYPVGYITGWRLWLEKPLTVDKLSTQILPNNLVWYDWRLRKGELFQAIRMEKNMICLLFSLIVLVAIFNIFTSLGLLVMEKRKEVAILQTQGLTRLQVMLVFMIHGASTSIIGALLGSSLGILLASKVNWLMPIFELIFNNPVLPVIIQPLQVIVITILVIFLALLSTIYPSWCAAIVHPAKVLRYG